MVLDQPVREAGRTWVLSRTWAENTVPTFKALLALAPMDRFGYRPVC